MASIINSISFKNFFNYYGEFEDNTYELEKGLNIIVADNGAGKSKFFNAFLWLFNDQILDSDDKNMKNISHAAVKIVSDKAKYETTEKNSVLSGIRVEYSDDRFQYEIIKSFELTRINSGAITDESTWSYTPVDIEVNRTELVLHKYRPITEPDEKKKIIDKLIAQSFRKYSFLQGEEVDNMIDFSKKSSIAEAVQNLTDIRKYERLVELTEEFKDKADKDLEKQRKATSAESKRFEEAVALRDELQKNLKNEEQKLKEFQTTYEQAEKEKAELDKVYANAEKRKELDEEIKPVAKKDKELRNEYEQFLDRLNSRFFDGSFAWITLGFHDDIRKWRQLNDRYIDKRAEKKALQHIESNPNDYFQFLPAGSPDAVSLSNMVENEHCYVCNRPAKKGSPEYEYLVKVKDRPSTTTTDKPFVKNDLRDFFGDLQNNAQPFYTKMNSVLGSTKATREKEAELRARIDKSEKKLKSLKDQRKDILIAGVDSETSSMDIIRSYESASKRIENARVKIEEFIKPRIDSLKKSLAAQEDEIKSLSVKEDIPQSYTDNYEISIDLARAALSAKDRVYHEMITLLEGHSNIHFQNLISNNDLAGGILKFEPSPNDAIEFKYLDSKGNVVYGSSEGFQRMKKFSVVMAIITANQSEYKYPLLADAPISAFGEGFTEGFFKATGDVFPQSIVLVKELYKKNDELKINELGKKLLSDDRVKTMYVNQVPEDAEQIELVTTKIKLK